MKTLKNYSLIYDDQCPLCQTYTKTFVITGILQKQGREAYQEMSATTCALVDKKRAVNEIALVNNETGEVTYGIDSLIKIAIHLLPFSRPVLHFSTIYWLLKKIYSFISYNRKIIMPGKRTNDTCVPDFNTTYRIGYLFFTWLITAYILNKYAAHLPGLSKSSYGREFIICGGQILFQTFILWKLPKQKLMEYLGNMMTISFAGALLLNIGLWTGNMFHSSDLYYICYFLSVVGLMFLEHLRRNKLIQLNFLPTLSWVIYRLLILTLLLL